MSGESASDWLDTLLTRITDAESMSGHALHLLRDSREHEPAVLELIASARRHVCLENYQIGRDEWADTLFSALCRRAAEGIRVRVLYDWFGSWPGPSPVWRDALIRAGGECRPFNPWRWRDPFGLLQRDHRKLISRDGEEAIISGWCQSARWRGQGHLDAWRDTGLRLVGPAAMSAEQAFAETWTLSGGIPFDLPDPPCCRTGPGARVRLLTGRPRNSPLFRLDQQLVSLARSRIWLTDAYPVGTPAYLDGLRRAAADGTDVRLLVPGSSDLPLIGFLARSSYRALLEAGVRVFEWNGTMLHAKTALFDDRWSRIGSTNLNPASWLGNHELDVLVDDVDFAARMARQFEDDLAHATEITLHQGQRVQLARWRPGRRRRLRHHQGSASAVRLTRAVSQAVRESRPLAASDASLLIMLGALGLAIAMIGFWQPAWLAWPFCLFLAGLSLGLFRVAYRRLQRDDASHSA